MHIHKQVNYVQCRKNSFNDGKDERLCLHLCSKPGNADQKLDCTFEIFTSETLLEKEKILTVNTEDPKCCSRHRVSKSL